MRARGTVIKVSGANSQLLQAVQIGGPDNPHDENWLQHLIHKHPSCLPMDQIEPGLSSLIPICMELNLSCGFLDNLMLTPDGDIVIVEVKLWRNPEMRRTVIAQALDYATALFRMNYSDFETAVLKSDLGDVEKPKKLYDFFGGSDVLTEEDFIDAVSLNLRNGRMVVLVVGDGIRSDLESLVDGLQSHAGFHFTFALVELGVFCSLDNDDLLIVPSTLAQTFGIERGIVRIDDQRSLLVDTEKIADPKAPSARHTISTDQFYESMFERNAELPVKLRAFVDKISELGVYADIKRSMNLKWNPPEGKIINFGYIMRNGQLYTDSVCWNFEDKNLPKQYNQELAKAFGLEVARFGSSNSVYVARDGKAPRIETLTIYFDDWYDAMERFQRRYYQEFVERK